MRIWLGLSYGGLVAAVYLGLRMLGGVGGLTAFANACAILALLHVVLFPSKLLKSFSQKGMWVRALLFSAVQILLLSSQQKGSTSIALAAALVGYSIGILFGSHVFKDESKVTNLPATLLALLGVILMPEVFQLGLEAIIAGILQSAGAFLSRSSMRKRESMAANIGSGFLAASIVSFSWLFITGTPASALVKLDSSVAILTGALLIVQYGYFSLIRTFTLQHTSILVLTRIPWAFLIEAIYLHMFPTVFQTLAAASIMLAGALVIYGQSHSWNVKRLAENEG